MLDYTKIENPYDQFVDRSIESEEPVNPDQPVREGGLLKDVWITSFIRSNDWKPGGIGFNIGGKTGTAEFKNVKAKGVRVMSSGATASTSDNDRALVVFKNETGYVFRVNPWYNPAVEINPNKDVGMSTALVITYDQVTSGLVAETPIIDVSNALSNCGTIGLKLALDSNSADHSVYGIKMTLNENGSGDTFAMWLNDTGSGPPVVTAAVGGSQDKKIRVKIGSTTYFIPCYTA